VLVDAIILTGGRSSRLDFTSKSEFVFEGSTLLERTVAAAEVARHIVIVGPDLTPDASRVALPTAVAFAREDPPFSGPVAGIAAGLTALAERPGAPSDATFVFACDMPHIALAVPEILRALEADQSFDGAISLDTDERLQPLAAVYRTASLAKALAEHRQPGSLESMPVFRFIDGLSLVSVRVPDGATTDVDSWDDAEQLGAQPPTLRHTREGANDERR